KVEGRPSLVDDWNWRRGREVLPSASPPARHPPPSSSRGGHGVLLPVPLGTLVLRARMRSLPSPRSASLRAPPAPAPAGAQRSNREDRGALRPRDEETDDRVDRGGRSSSSSSSRPSQSSSRLPGSMMQWDPKRRYRKGDRITYEDSAYEAASNSPEGPPFDPFLRAGGARPLHNELGHPSATPARVPVLEPAGRVRHHALHREGRVPAREARGGDTGCGTVDDEEEEEQL
ncbi:hypothetical protein THAOC_01041, partial [Thalassiosira oceanica]